MLSLTSCLLNLGGNLIRTFTTFVLVKDPVVMAGAMVGGLFNTIIFYQCVVTLMRPKQQQQQQQGGGGAAAVGLAPA